MDTGYGLRGRCELLFLHWRHVADCRMQAVAIVEPFDELEEPTSRCLARLVAGCGIELGLHAAEASVRLFTGEIVVTDARSQSRSLLSKATSGLSHGCGVNRPRPAGPQVA